METSAYRFNYGFTFCCYVLPAFYFCCRLDSSPERAFGFNYLDDFIGLSPCIDASRHFDELGTLLQFLS